MSSASNETDCHSASDTSVQLIVLLRGSALALPVGAAPCTETDGLRWRRRPGKVSYDGDDKEAAK